MNEGISLGVDEPPAGTWFFRVEKAGGFAAVGLDPPVGGEFSHAASPENDLKWGTLRPTQTSFAWSNADAIATFNRAAGQQMRGHTYQ